MIVDPVPPVNKTRTVDSNSEEDDVVILNSEDVSKPINR